MAKIVWIIIGFLGAKVTNEALFLLLNQSQAGVNISNAALPAVGASFVLCYCFYNAISGKSIFGIPAPGTHVKCPDCRELIKKDARKCKHCGCSLRVEL